MRDASRPDVPRPDAPKPDAPLLGIDLGGTTTRIGIFASPDAPRFTVLARFPTDADYGHALDQIAHETRRGMGAAWAQLAGVGVAIGAQVARDGQGVLTSPNLPDYVGRPLVADLAARLGCPVRLAHDGVCGVLAERRFGALLAYERAAYLTLSTGTGAAIHLRTAATALTISIQVGHQLLDGNPLPCLCGQVGCLETLTGGRQIALREGRPPAEIDDPLFWEGLAQKVALGLVNLAQLTRVEAVAVSGGIALARPALRPRLRELVSARLRDATLLVLDAALGEDAPLVGAAALLAEPEERILH
ncbi:MAG: ROK family protein [Ktedonobacterales bacterium]|nr:ROK family protein [Ktedonobacterales bacterium]